jgi:CBS domain-containing protein
MSPRAAWRLDAMAMGFQTYDFTSGKAGWLANGLPREGTNARVSYAGDVVDARPPICGLADTVAEVRARLAGNRYGFCLVLNQRRIVLGRVRRGTLAGADDAATVESVMEAGPSTVRPSTPAHELIERLAARDLTTAVVTTPGGCLVGVFHREDAQAQLARPGAT